MILPKSFVKLGFYIAMISISLLSCSSQTPIELGTPLVSPVGGSYFTTDSISIVLYSPDSELTIYYTLDGSTPTSESEVYTNPIQLVSDTLMPKYYILHAIAIKDDAHTSAVTTMIYSVKYAYGFAGPAGGYVFYDKGYFSSGWRYLEAAPSSTEGHNKVWGGYLTSVGSTTTFTGWGSSNTEEIVAKYGENEPYDNKPDYAAKFCYDLVFNGYEDWFLPSKEELNLMYVNLKSEGKGGFSSNEYFSSSEMTSNHAWSQDFYNGLQGSSLKFSSLLTRVRAIRAY